MERLHDKLAFNDNGKVYQAAFALTFFTIIYNLGEGLISMYLGFEDESLTLFGFGVDSFIEVISAIGVAHMIYRIRANVVGSRDQFERTALRITGVSFYLLVVALVSTGVYKVLTDHNPKTTFWGIVVSLISIAVMWLLIMGKTAVGKKLNSPAILADAQCTRVCIYMSIVLLISSVLYEYLGLRYMDRIGTLGLAYFSFKEGRECFDKAESNNFCSCGHC
jgi:hypothetical protein